MEFNLKTKTVLVTGATQGVGAEIAREAARQGAEAVVIAGRSTEKGRAVCRELEKTGCRAHFIRADLGEPDAPAALFAEAIALCGRIDCVVNSAGITTRASFVDATLEKWESLFALNARAPFFIMQAFIRHCLERGQPGSLVNIQSMNAHCGTPELAIYSATKGTLATMTRNAANAHLADRIRINGINMGWSPTDAERDMQANILGKGAGWLDEAAQDHPLGRLLEPSEVARLCVYLLSDYSGLQTGTCVDLEQRVVGAPPAR